MSSTSQNTISNSNDETCIAPNEDVSTVSTSKNVKFLIPLSRSGMNSNGSTLSLMDSTTRSITHVKDIFSSSSPLLQSQTITTKMKNNERDVVTISSSSNSLTTSTLFNVDCRLDHNEIITSDNEQQALLLQNNGSNQK